ncbi:MAG: GGDEF domain-containing protein, partial [Clostridia bacterium]
TNIIFTFVLIISLFLIVLIDLGIINILKEGVINLNKIIFAMIMILAIFIVSYYSVIKVTITAFMKEIDYDHLTGLGSRRKLYEDLNLLINRSKKFMVCYIDFNEFKQINDTYGHDAGDTILKVFSKDIKKIAKNNIYGYRIGGDEFVLIIKDTEDYLVFLNNIKKISGKEVVINSNITAKLKFAIGITENDFASTADTLIKRADQNMYKDKKI